MRNMLVVCQYVATSTFSGAYGALPLNVAAGTRYRTPAEACVALTAAFAPGLSFGFATATGTIYVICGPGVTTWTVDFGDLVLAQYLGWATQVVTEASAHGICLGYWYGPIRESQGYQPKTATMDSASHDGRAYSQMATASTDTFKLWGHLRSSVRTLAADLALLYAAASAWVRTRISWVSDEDFVWHYGAIGKGWECAPESMDSETISIELEVVE